MTTDLLRRRRGRFLFVSQIEQMLYWAEPIIQRVCRSVWREIHPRGLELKDLEQEGRIEVFLGARRIAAAEDRQAMAATLVRRRAIKAARALSDRYLAPHPLHSIDDPTEAETDTDDLCEG